MATTLPIATPFYMTKAGAPDLLIDSGDPVTGLAQYNAGLAMGYAFQSTTTTEAPVNPAQPDPNAPVEPS